MNLNEKTTILLSLLDEYKALGIADQIDYNKFYLYSLITHSTAIEGSTVTEIENQLLIDAREQEALLPSYEFMFDEHIRNIRREIEAYSKSQTADLIRPASDLINVISDPITERLYQVIQENNKLNYAEYGILLGVSKATVKRRLGELRKAGMIMRVGSNKTGYWKVVSLKNRKEDMV